MNVSENSLDFMMEIIWSASCSKNNKDLWHAAPGMTPPRKLTFNVTDKVEEDIAEAQENLES